ncbi:MAG TPA: N-acetylmuramoyl-L-alanine amidase [Cytophagaceae bacterium]|jgi:N-acetylmuramoyl-L-alanine amidase|nr:N-acetylmuramoyl-L-alanine amidase [Cytophagaceae bacterium]
MLSKTLIYLFAITLVLCSSFTILEKTEYHVKTIVIDAGHGGKDPGCSNSNQKEKLITLDIALKLGEILKQNMPDVKVIYTRKDDHFVELHDRAAIANKEKADLFISIHVNAGPSQFKGTETYCMGLHKGEQNLSVAQRENSSILMEKDQEKKYDGFDPNSPQSYILFSLYQSAYLANSTRLAGKIETEFESKNRRHSRGVKQAGFLVLWKTAMPSVLVESGFITHDEDAQYLGSEVGKMETAWGIFSAIEDYKNDIEEE